MKAALVALLLVTGCAPAPEATKPDPTKAPDYQQTTQRLAAMMREAEADFKAGQKDEAAKLIVDGQPLLKRLLDVSQPPVAAAEAASDLDDLYARMLLSNRHYGDARLLFQQNVSRWRHWQPQTPETARRMRQAIAAIAECDRHILE